MVLTRPTRAHLALIAVPLLLIVVAILQIGRAAVLDQSSYAGYGFGMFATYENELSRWTEVTVTDADAADFMVKPPAGLDLAAQEVPTIGNLARLAEAVLASDPTFTSVHAEVWSVTVSGRPMRLERILIAESVVERT